MIKIKQQRQILLQISLTKYSISVICMIKVIKIKLRYYYEGFFLFH